MFLIRSLSPIRKITHCFMSRLAVQPSVSLMSEKVKIFGDGYKPNQQLTIKATVQNEAERCHFVSFAHIQTEVDGSFDMSTSESKGGTYCGVEPMGLFWSMGKQEKSYDRLQTVDASQPFVYSFKVYENFLSDFTGMVELNNVDIERRFLSKDVKRVELNGNVKGTLFVPQGVGPFPAVITINGGIKRGRPFEDYASLLANEGFVTLTLGYFGGEGLPKNYSHLKIEYFEEAIDFVKNHESVDETSIGVVGFSKGAEIMLAMCHFLQNITSGVWVNGSVVSVGGIMTYKDQKIPEIGVDVTKVKFLSEKLVNIQECLNMPEPHEIIPFDKCQTDLLFIDGVDDYNWRTDFYADLAERMMLGVGKTNYKIVKYEDLGHLVDAPYSPVATIVNHPLVPPEFKVYYGGKNTKSHAIQQVDAYKEIVMFFNRTLKKPLKSVL